MGTEIWIVDLVASELVFASLYILLVVAGKDRLEWFDFGIGNYGLGCGSFDMRLRLRYPDQ